MPHDKNGTLVEVGDEVLIRARVKEVYPGADYCNVQVETIEKMAEEHETGSAITLNAKQVEKVAPAAAPAAEASTEQLDEQPAETIAST